MTIETDYYGTIEYEEGDLITFQDGLFGFPQLHRFLPLRLSEDNDSILMLVSIEEKRVVFVVINPLFLTPDYQPTLTPEELAYLGVADVGELSCYAICVVKDNYLESTVNLKCPLLIHPDTRRAIQVIMDKSPYGYSQPLGSFAAVTGESADKGGEADACTAQEGK